MVMSGFPHWGRFFISGPGYVKKMVANYNTAFPHFQCIQGEDLTNLLTYSTIYLWLLSWSVWMLRCNI
jgi:hypothetical protein